MQILWQYAVQFQVLVTEVLITTVLRSVQWDNLVLYCRICECGECGCNYECPWDCSTM